MKFHFDKRSYFLEYKNSFEPYTASFWSFAKIPHVSARSCSNFWMNMRCVIYEFSLLLLYQCSQSFAMTTCNYLFVIYVTLFLSKLRPHVSDSTWAEVSTKIILRDVLKTWWHTSFNTVHFEFNSDPKAVKILELSKFWWEFPSPIH